MARRRYAGGRRFSLYMEQLTVIDQRPMSQTIWLTVVLVFEDALKQKRTWKYEEVFGIKEL